MQVPQMQAPAATQTFDTPYPWTSTQTNPYLRHASVKFTVTMATSHVPSQYLRSNKFSQPLQLKWTSKNCSQSSPGCNGCKGGGHKAEQAKELGKAEEDFQASQW